MRFLVLPSRLFIDVDAGSGDVFLGGIHDNGYRRAAEAESMALGGACLPYGGSFEGGILVSLVFFIYNTLYPALNLRNIYRYRRFIVDYSSEAQRISLDWLAAVQVFILACVPFRWRDCCSIWRLLLFLFRVAGGVANVRVLYDALL